MGRLAAGHPRSPFSLLVSHFSLRQRVQPVDVAGEDVEGGLDGRGVAQVDAGGAEGVDREGGVAGLEEVDVAPGGGPAFLADLAASAAAAAMPVAYWKT